MGHPLPLLLRIGGSDVGDDLPGAIFLLLPGGQVRAFPDLRLAVIAVEMPLPPAHGKSDITLTQKLSPGWLPGELEARGI